jgi:hypothetical protein
LRRIVSTTDTYFCNYYASHRFPFISICFAHQFRQHKSTTKPEQLQQFFTEWEKYCIHIEQTGREQQSRKSGLVDNPSSHSASVLRENGYNDAGFGRDVAMDAFNEEQEGQLQKLKEEAVKAAAGK